MEVIKVWNVHEALPEGCRLMREKGVPTSTRNGPARVLPSPLTTVYSSPKQRVLFWRERDANPFFHFFECLWMFAGRRDVKWIAEFSSNIANYSDDGVTFNGAYGHRWRRFFGFDQLEQIIQRLRADPNCRRQVLAMWSARDLKHQDTKDVPCNTQAFFQVSPYGKLDLMVTNRSNDLIWGAYGANAVHFSFLLEVMAALIDVPMGRYIQVSMNTHVYDHHWPLVLSLANQAPDVMSGGRHEHKDPYMLLEVEAYPVVDRPNNWMADIGAFMDGATRGYSNPFFTEVALPLLDSWRTWKAMKDRPKRIDAALEPLAHCAATDWRRAAREWLERRRVP